MIIQRMLRSFYSDEPTESSDGSRSPFRLRLNAMDDLLEDAPPIRIDFDSELDVSCLFHFCYQFKVLVTIGTFNPWSANPTIWSDTLKQFVDNLPTSCLSVFDHFLGFALKGLRPCQTSIQELFRKLLTALIHYYFHKTVPS